MGKHESIAELPSASVASTGDAASTATIVAEKPEELKAVGIAGCNNNGQHKQEQRPDGVNGAEAKRLRSDGNIKLETVKVDTENASTSSAMDVVEEEAACLGEAEIDEMVSK